MKDNAINDISGSFARFIPGKPHGLNRVVHRKKGRPEYEIFAVFWAFQIGHLIARITSDQSCSALQFHVRVRRAMRSRASHTRMLPSRASETLYSRVEEEKEKKEEVLKSRFYDCLKFPRCSYVRPADAAEETLASRRKPITPEIDIKQIAVSGRGLSLSLSTTSLYDYASLPPPFRFNVKASATPTLLTLGRAREERARGGEGGAGCSPYPAPTPDRIEFVGTRRIPAEGHKRPRPYPTSLSFSRPPSYRPSPSLSLSLVLFCSPLL